MTTSPVSRRTLLRGTAALGVGLIPAFATAGAAEALGVDSRLAVLWSANRAELGAPLGGATKIPGGIRQHFQGGTMYHSTAAGPSVVRGKLRQVFWTGGGTPSMGFPLLVETKSPDYSSCYTQWSVRRGSQVWWSKSHGGFAIPADRTIRLPGAANFRDAAGEGSGLKVGTKRMRRRLLFRCSQTGGLPDFSRFVLQTLWIEKVVSLGGTDATIPGITVVKTPVRNLRAVTDVEKLAMYRNYVTSAENRLAIGRAATVVANAAGPVLLHCEAGRDRTGWVTALIHTSLGMSSSRVLSEYQKSNSYTGSTVVKAAYLQAALSQAKASYGSVSKYLTTGCGVSSATLKKLKTRLLV